MSAENVYKAVTSVAVGDGQMPCAHIAFKVGSAPALPFCVYYLENIDGFAADNRFSCKKNSWVVEHYWKDYDKDVEQALDNVLEETFGVFNKSETWVESEQCAETVYRFTSYE